MAGIGFMAVDDSRFGLMRSLWMDGAAWYVAKDVAQALGYGMEQQTKPSDGTGLMVFSNSELGRVRAMEIDGTPWFVGKDVAEILGYAETAKAIRERVDPEDKGVSKMDTPGGAQDVTIINESGLYSLIMSSKLPAAKKFKRWVTSEVLPNIRKFGVYQTQTFTSQKEAVEKLVPPEHRRLVSYADLREGLTDWLRSQESKRNLMKYLEEDEHGAVSARSRSTADIIMQQFSPYGVTVIDIDGVTALTTPLGGCPEFVAWATDDVGQSVMKVGLCLNVECEFDVKALPEWQQKALKQYENKLVGNDRRRQTNKAKREADELSDAQILAQISHRLASKLFKGDMKHGANAMYALISKDMRIDWEERKDEWLRRNNVTDRKKVPSRAQLIRPEEMDEAMDVLAWYGRERGIELDDLIAKRKKGET